MMVAVYILIFLKNMRREVCSFLLILIGFTVFSQNSKIEELRSQQAKYNSEIKKAQALLSKKGSSRKYYLSELTVLNSKIKAQEKLIHSYQVEIGNINTLIEGNRKLVASLKKEIDDIRANYKNLILEANRQKYSNLNEFLILFSAESFSEAYRRFILLKQYTEYRKMQADILYQTKSEYDSIIVLNQKNLARKTQSLNALNVEISKMQNSIKDKEIYISKLKKEENWLKEDIRKKTKASKDLENSIENILKELTASKKSFEFNNFNQAKGKLEWPVRDGIVTSYFGKHNHAVLKGVQINNNGIDITAPKDNLIKCVYEGTVSRVIAIPGYNKAIILRHGNYLTVYANLVTVFVKSGDKVKTDQNLGKIYTEGDSDQGVLHFEIWKENEKIDPLLWLQNM